MSTKTKLIITGYNGYIGKCLIKFLRERKINFVKLDLSKKKILFKNFTHLIHLQFYIDNKKSNYKRNILEMEKVVDICLKNKLFLIFPSTASFSFNNKTRVNDNLKIFNNYTKAKDACEKIILKCNKLYNLNYTILRIFNVYGNNIDNRYYISQIIKKFKQSKKFSTINIKFSENVRDYINIDDLNLLLLKVIKKYKNGIFEVGSGKKISIRKLSEILNEILKKENNLKFMNPHKTKINSYSESKIKKTVKTFSWTPKIELKNGLKKFILK